MAIQGDMTKRAMKIFVIIALIAGAATSVTPNVAQLDVDTGIATHSELIVKANLRVKITCTSDGGIPAVNDIKITCPFDRQNTEFYTSPASYSTYFYRYMHGKQCICSVGHVSLQERFNTSLIIVVVVAPERPLCNQVFNTTSVQVSCSTSKVFPQANCKWRSTHQNYSSKLGVAEKSVQYDSYERDREEYYTTTCSTSLTLDYPSGFSISIDMYPDFHNFILDFSFATVTVTVDIVVGPSKITSFKVEGSGTNQVEVNAGSKALMSCQASGNPLPSMRIESTNIYGGNDVVKQEDDNSLTHEMFLTCNKTGTYTCSAKNIFNSQSDVQKINLKIKCKAEYYITHDTEPSFGVPVNIDFNITLPILVHPMPTKYNLYKEGPYVLRNEPVRFNYTDERFSLGEISIPMKLLSPSDYGLYSVKVMNHQNSTLRFKLTARGPPLCPTDFIVQNISTKTLTISWRPGFDGGLNQTFSVISHNLAKKLTESHPVGETSNEVLVHNVTGLSDGTLYVLSLETENSEGKTTCPHVNINVMTHIGSKQITSAMYSLILYIGLTVALIIISGVACGLLYKRNETPSEVYYLQPVHSVEQVQDISPNEYDLVFDDYEDALS